MMKWLPAEMLFKGVFLVEICMKQAKKSSTLATTITSFLFTLKGQASPRKLWQDLGNKRRVRPRISEEMDRVLHSVSYNGIWQISKQTIPSILTFLSCFFMKFIKIHWVFALLWGFLALPHNNQIYLVTLRPHTVDTSFIFTKKVKCCKMFVFYISVTLRWHSGVEKKNHWWISI